MSNPSFQRGEGHWLGAAEVYDAAGRYAGEGLDSRAVRRDLDDGTVEVEVSFAGPFRIAGSYVIADRGDHRLYQGPLNYGYAEVLGDGLVDTNNYFSDVGFSQRLMLMVLPGGEAQLSLALLSRGEQPAYTVVGEYNRRPGPEPAPAANSGRGPAGEAWSGRPHSLLERPGTWSGTLQVLDATGAAAGFTDYAERTEPAEDGRKLSVSMSGSGFAADEAILFSTDGRQHWTGGGRVVGSESTWGGRALAGNLLFGDDRLRLWRREVVRHDGSCKGVLHTWYRGGTRVGVAYGAVDFLPVGGER